MTASDRLGPEAVLLDLVARTKTDVLTALADRAAALSRTDPGKIVRAVHEREKLGSTGVGSGVALPHAGVPGLVEPVVLVARLARSVDWEAIDDRPVDLVVAVLSPIGGPGTSFDLLAHFARHLRSEDTRRRLRGSPDVDGILRTLCEAFDRRPPRLGADGEIEDMTAVGEAATGDRS